MLTVKYCNNKKTFYLNLPKNIIKHLGCSINDNIVFKNNKDGSFTLTKVNNTTTTGGTTTTIDCIFK